MLALLIGMGPLATACEMVFDFDRTPLQPVYEAGVDDEEDSGGSSGGSSGGTRDGGGGRDGGGNDAARDTGADARDAEDQ